VFARHHCSPNSNAVPFMDGSSTRWRPCDRPRPSDLMGWPSARAARAGAQIGTALLTAPPTVPGRVSAASSSMPLLPDTAHPALGRPSLRTLACQRWHSSHGGQGHPFFQPTQARTGAAAAATSARRSVSRRSRPASVPQARSPDCAPSTSVSSLARQLPSRPRRPLSKAEPEHWRSR
jgi:hypothetical protein